jgi:hypothetical protein
MISAEAFAVKENFADVFQGQARQSLRRVCGALSEHSRRKWFGTKKRL